MRRVYVRCYAELNDHLAPERRQRTFTVELPEAVSLGTLMTRLGIPSAEIDLALINSRSCGLHHEVKEGDHISLFPVFESFEISPLAALRDRPLRRPAFVLDVHLGKLASHLRLFGIDAAYRNTFSKETLVRIAIDETRALLSRDPAFAFDPRLTRFFLIRATDPERQLLEVLKRFDLAARIEPFSRCIECNTLVEVVPKAMVEDRLPPNVRALYEEFRLCHTCGRIYWKGSHHRKMEEMVERMVKRLKMEE